jgi:sugar/nucleoside kinase (ribokinase family)
MAEKRLTLLLGSSVDIFYLIDRYPEEGDFTMGRELETLAGGPPLNVGCVAAAAGAAVAALDSLNPEDSATDIIISTLKRHGVDVSHVVFDPESRDGKVVILSNGDKRTYVVIDPVRKPYAVTPELQELLNTSGYLYSMTQIPDLSFADRETIREARRHGAKMVFDGSARYDTPESASILLDLGDGLFINTTSYGRLAQCLGRDPKEVLLECGYEFICVTDGENGASCYTASGNWTTPAIPLEHVLDGTGAGDAFAGTFLAGRLHGMDFGTCLRRAAAGGAYACTVMGGQGGCCSGEQLTEFAGRYGWEV